MASSKHAKLSCLAGTDCCCSSWTLETKQHHTGWLFPDLTARSFEADKITLKCKGDMTVSSEPDGSILCLARQDLSSGSAAMFDAAVFEISMSGTVQSYVVNEQILSLMFQLKY